MWYYRRKLSTEKWKKKCFSPPVRGSIKRKTKNRQIFLLIRFRVMMLTVVATRHYHREPQESLVIDHCAMHKATTVVIFAIYLLLVLYVYILHISCAHTHTHRVLNFVNQLTSDTRVKEERWQSITVKYHIRGHCTLYFTGIVSSVFYLTIYYFIRYTSSKIYLEAYSNKSHFYFLNSFLYSFIISHN